MIGFSMAIKHILRVSTIAVWHLGQDYPLEVGERRGLSMDETCGFRLVSDRL